MQMRYQRPLNMMLYTSKKHKERLSNKSELNELCFFDKPERLLPQLTFRPSFARHASYSGNEKKCPLTQLLVQALKCFTVGQLSVGKLVSV